MTVQDVLEYFKSANKFGKITGFSRTSVSRWKNRESIPYLSQVKIEHITQGKLKAVKPVKD